MKDEPKKEIVKANLKADSKESNNNTKQQGKQKKKKKESDTVPYQPADWKDPKLIAEMLVAAGIIIVFMALSGGLSTFGLSM